MPFERKEESVAQQQGPGRANPTGSTSLPAVGRDQERQLNNSIAKLRELGNRCSKFIEDFNNKSDVDLSNHFKSTFISNSVNPTDRRGAQIEIQIAAAKTEAEMIELWMKQYAEQSKDPQGVMEKFKECLRKIGVPEEFASKMQFPRDANGAIDSKALLGGWHGNLNYRGRNVGLLQKFHDSVGAIAEVPGSCPIQLLKEITTIMIKLTPVLPPPAQTGGPTIKVEGGVTISGRQNTDPGQTTSTNTIASAPTGGTVGTRVGQLTQNVRNPNFWTAFLIGAVIPTKVGDACVDFCKDLGGGLGGGGVGGG